MVAKALRHVQLAQITLDAGLTFSRRKKKFAELGVAGRLGSLNRGRSQEASMNGGLALRVLRLHRLGSEEAYSTAIILEMLRG
ncbi:hypothetical protein [Lacipirellula limnantheis]|uniref:Uncharacterized protein n=1 Tax=Lacipirellula limnantheis TaxID=2528024 RepID=A0A517TUI9_9BACT|nr:hypothetical protein [Lacipirellula limnantheis]QDT72039.1 hypothetical protein I41_12050 [Lacipirellula limnantheis]